MGKVKLKIGQKVLIKCMKKRQQRKFIGNIISITNDFITVQNNIGIKESFSFRDFYTGMLKITDIEG